MKIWKKILIGILISSFIILFFLWKNPDEDLYLVSLEKSGDSNLYIADTRFRELQQMTDGEVVVDIIAAHTDGNFIILLFRGEDYRQAIGKYSITEKKIVEVITLDNILLEKQRVVFLDWDILKNELIVATKQKVESQNLWRFEIQTIDTITNTVNPIFSGDHNYYYLETPMYSYNGENEIVLDIDDKIYMITISTGEIEYVANGKNPFWTPDGNRITYLEDSGNFKFAIYNINVESSEKEYINDGVFHIYRDGGLSWSPDEKYIYYIEARGESDPVSIVRFNATTGTSRKYLRSNKRNIKVYPLFVTNVYN